MKKPSRQIRVEIARLQEQLKQAETREAERIGRIALRAGIGEIEIEESALLAAFEDLTVRFRDGDSKSAGKRSAANGSGVDRQTTQVAPGPSAGEAEQG